MPCLCLALGGLDCAKYLDGLCPLFWHRHHCHHQSHPHCTIIIKIIIINDSSSSSSSPVYLSVSAFQSPCFASWLSCRPPPPPCHPWSRSTPSPATQEIWKIWNFKMTEMWKISMQQPIGWNISGPSSSASVVVPGDAMQCLQSFCTLSILCLLKISQENAFPRNSWAICSSIVPDIILIERVFETRMSGDINILQHVTTRKPFLDLGSRD